MPLFAGTAEMAIRTGAEIVPIAFEKFGKNFVVNIGKNITPKNYALSQKQELTVLLRDTLSTLKWEIWAGSRRNPEGSFSMDTSASICKASSTKSRTKATPWKRLNKHASTRRRKQRRKVRSPIWLS